MSDRKMVHLETEMLNKLVKVKNGIIWAWLCAEDKVKTLPEILIQYPQLSTNAAKRAIKKLLDIGAIEEVSGGYQSVKEYYYITN